MGKLADRLPMDICYCNFRTFHPCFLHCFALQMVAEVVHKQHRLWAPNKREDPPPAHFLSLPRFPLWIQAASQRVHEPASKACHSREVTVEQSILHISNCRTYWSKTWHSFRVISLGHTSSPRRVFYSLIYICADFGFVFLGCHCVDAGWCCSEQLYCTIVWVYGDWLDDS